MIRPFVGFALLLALALPAAAQQAPPEAVAMQEFLDNAREPCRMQPAQTCVDIGFHFAAADPSRGLTVDDVRLLRRRLGLWYDHNQATLPPRTKASLGLGVLLADGMTMPGLHAAFDANGDGYVSQAELLADVTLDERPLGEVLADPQAVDRDALAARLGVPRVLLAGLWQ